MDLKDQYFGCEIEMTGLTRQQAAQAVAALFGTSARQTFAALPKRAASHLACGSF
ncbi:MAG TPA: amidoligase family protein [Candidatus Anaerofilum faecale]|nr:amidoligase family protein [Candidatus Anaerofilum faecale]